MKIILAITASRSDYDLMSGIYKCLSDDKIVELKLLVTGAHLSKTSGYSVSEIEKDNFNILLKIESLIDGDSFSTRIKSASVFLQGSIDVVQTYAPDLIVYAGDREETIMGALLGAYLNIPTAHFFGGDHAKDGHVDNPVRHAVSKLSSIHFVTLEEHKNRLMKMGESSERIFVIGNPALDRFYGEAVIEKNKLIQSMGITSGFDSFVLLIFHPITEEIDVVGEYFDNILKALKLKNICAFVSYPNIDHGNTKILAVIEKYKNDSCFFFYKNLDRSVFVSIFKQARFIIGNSSAGILEAATIPIPSINVGKRQMGRQAGNNVVFCKGDENSISLAIERVSSPLFKSDLIGIRNPYGDGTSCKKACRLLHTIDFYEFLYKKEDPLEVNVD